MHYPDLIQGTLIKRYKRFLADVQLNDGSIVTAHCPNTGAMTGCAEPGWQVWLSPSTNPKRKLPFTWEVVKTNKNHWIGINTHKANAIVKEALSKQLIPELVGYNQHKAEVKFGEENSRIDFLLMAEHKPDCYVEVKSVTLLDNELGYFPDAKTIRGQKHLRELSSIASRGERAVLLFCVQHTGINSVTVAQHIDPDYAKELSLAMDKGVEVLCYGCHIDAEKIYVNQSVRFFI
ncbi:DNA/RNA nuclease SfsA [Paraglaciecola aquimarina]|uniref:Sugar fermentation stimulation protein homolog n=1 Tax=Paraglaciecola algarum TaxID=3050085 RepID=A0ABS9D3D6_9ALTE|nr:DNA/RNA nuclease SfsA [Paraglaciecola sp. G1-23]MCF2947446.1 DNA/RNA nuclease SfsA [Paraglaciecola sp. G1-23]